MMSDTLAHADHLPVPHAGDLSRRKIIDGFDYESLSPEDAEALREHSARIRSEVKKTALAIVAIGRELIAVKKTLGHGRFVAWVETECDFTVRSAQNYMKICRLAKKYETVAHLPPTMAYRITRRRVGRELLRRLSARASRDGAISEAELDNICEEFKEIRSAERNPTRAPSHRRHRSDCRAAGNAVTGSPWSHEDGIRTAECPLHHGEFWITWSGFHLYNDTLLETVRLLNLERRRRQFEQKFEDL